MVTLPMAKPRLEKDKVLTPAEKQARHRAKQSAEADRLRGLLYTLERAVWNAAERGDALADTVKAGSIEGMITNLTRHFETPEE
jgi:hypothetical protein